MNKYDEKDWGIEIAHCDDDDLLLRQGECGCGDEVTAKQANIAHGHQQINNGGQAGEPHAHG